MMKSKFAKVLTNVAYGIHTDTNVVVVVHNELEPTDEEWYDHYLPDHLKFAEMGFTRRSIIVSDGGAPSIKQRKALDKIHDALDQSKEEVRIAIVSHVPGVVRIAVMVINVLFGKNRLRIFDTVDAATAWLGLHGETRNGVCEVIDSLKSALDTTARDRAAS